MSRWVLHGLVSAMILAPLAVVPPGAWGQSQPNELPSSLTEEAFLPQTVLPSVDSVEFQVRALAKAGKRAAACDLAQRSVQASTEPTRGRLRWHVGHQCVEPASSSALQAVASSDHPLSPWAQLERAERIRDRNPAQALALTDALQHDWAGLSRVRVLRGLALLAVGDPSAEAVLRELVQRSPEWSAAATVAVPLAETLQSRPALDAKIEALALWRRVASRTPLTTTGRNADLGATRLLAELTEDLRSTLARPTIADENARGQALWQAHRYAQAAELWSELSQRSELSDAERCAARLSHVRALSRLRDQRGALVSHVDGLLSQCSDPNSVAWAHYYAAQALWRQGDLAAAKARYELLASHAPTHSLADDALYKASVVATDQHDAAGAEALLRRLLAEIPTGDMRGQARFSLAWGLRQRGEHEAALSELRQLLAEGPDEATEGMEGRARYWLARTLMQLDRIDEAVSALEQTVQAAPLSYYAQHALSRLQEIAPEVASRLQPSLTPPETGSTLRFSLRPELRQPALLRAIELLAVGEVERARQELDHLGALAPDADTELLWIVASLFHAAEHPAPASRLARDRLRGFTTDITTDTARGLWRIGYPRAYAPLIDDAAAEAGVPATFVRAVAREESAFDPEAVSSAGAYGLIQLMEATAREVAKGLRLPSDPGSLRRPEINVRIGARFMRSLWTRYADNPAVVPAAYNAGPGAADRWLRERADQGLDEWIENIPYDETRRYSRRVLQSYGVYSLLDDGRLPLLAARLPTTATPRASLQAP